MEAEEQSCPNPKCEDPFCTGTCRRGRDARGRFAKGNSLRTHQLTQAEKLRGWESLCERMPAIGPQAKKEQAAKVLMKTDSIRYNNPDLAYQPRIRFGINERERDPANWLHKDWGKGEPGANSQEEG